jgi:hypothetical protein
MIAVTLATSDGRSYLAAMVKILISPAAYAAIAKTLPLGTVAVEPERGCEWFRGYARCKCLAKSATLSL